MFSSILRNSLRLDCEGRGSVILPDAAGYAEPAQVKGSCDMMTGGQKKGRRQTRTRPHA